ncbi:hypothetical protein E2C01_001336 [Portunus trituberculatus]|uniref:Uncharacterized protein n=1 Tax=Portunus trituberculatus TaxID=210409 RepID=A0A5B7CMB3_PORTR|nr:hypothetical protein [Portunus trituberculatus]
MKTCHATEEVILYWLLSIEKQEKTYKNKIDNDNNRNVPVPFATSPSHPHPPTLPHPPRPLPLNTHNLYTQHTPGVTGQGGWVRGPDRDMVLYSFTNLCGGLK